MAKNYKVVIIGIGNLILQDEGVGVHAVRALEGRELPPGVEVIDGGTYLMDLLSVIQEAERIIVIDALRGGEKPGTIYRLSPDDLMGETERPLSLHQVGLLEVLGMARQLGGSPQAVIIGVEPKEISWGMELTPEVQARLPRVIDAIFEELKGL
ncbi:MAG: HyaD/HybD family hydrogenase maturation endopeptidase [Deltaproteobacteria bacterium]|nr:HyaD/HybD family hydrogenase maturation endopeptidase [Deltaproteobacteria bacterium]